MEKLTVKIEQDILVNTVVKYGVLDRMQVGESFLVPPDANLNSILACLQYRRKVHGKRYTRRTTPAGVRIWRVC